MVGVLSLTPDPVADMQRRGLEYLAHTMLKFSDSSK